jgi:catechol 2,3-dioxygenase-like lactoylglutathione lyase family enzyme
MSAPPRLANVRLARPTNDLLSLVRFYRDGIGLPVIDGFEGHDGFDGVMIGLPGSACHMELTQHPATSTRATPGPEDLLVLYFESVEERDAVVARLSSMGHAPVAPENPYWIGKAITVPDPDGWRVVLFAGAWPQSEAGPPARFRGAST